MKQVLRTLSFNFSGTPALRPSRTYWVYIKCVKMGSQALEEPRYLVHLFGSFDIVL